MSLLYAFALQAALETPDVRAFGPTRAWLVGTWIHSADRTDVDRTACKAGTTYRYRADGRTSFAEGRGRWTLSGRTLTETMTALTDPADGEVAADLGRPIRSRLVRIGPDEAVRIFGGGHRDRMLRCRPGDRR